MRTRFILIVFFFISTQIVCAQDLTKALASSFSIVVTNPANVARRDVSVYVSDAEIKRVAGDFNKNAFVVFDKRTEIASQFNSNDGTKKGIVFTLDKLDAGEQRTLTIRYKKDGELKREYAKRTQAELAHKVDGKWVNREYEGGKFVNVNKLNVPAEHKDHSWFIRYEGPGWESDKVGYRLYLDQRNATDVFGKTTKAMTLQDVGLDGFESYHHMQSWGMDVMKVGPSLGIGSIGAFHHGKVTRVEKTDSVSCRILENGNVYASFLAKYSGWNTGHQKTVLTSITAISAGSRLSEVTLKADAKIDSLCTGIVKDKNAKLLSDPGSPSSFGFIATYGKQSLNNDNLGLAVFFDPKDSKNFTADANSHIVLFRPTDGLKYYFMAAWEGEPGGITSEEAFMEEVKRVAQLMAQPVGVAVKK